MNKNIFFIFIFLFVFQLKAEVVLLKNGQRYEGKIINQTREKIQVQLKDGRVITLNKENIQRIQYGPTPEELRKEEEERKRLEEQKRKQEEERRRLEEQKRIEEERRRLEELKTRREPLLKRREFLISFGSGFSNNSIPFEKIENNFTKLFFFGSLSYNNFQSFNYAFQRGIKKATLETQFSLEYKYNQWITGFKNTVFSLLPLVRDIRYYEMMSERNPGGQFYFNFSFSSPPLNMDTSRNKYSLNQIYGKYIFYKFSIWEGVVSYVSLPFGVGNHNFNLDFSNLISEYSLLYRNFVLFNTLNKINLHSNDTTFSMSGISLENIMKDEFLWSIDVFFYVGSFHYNLEKTFTFNSTDIVNINNFINGKQKGIEFTNQIEKKLYKNLWFFINLSYYEIQSQINKFNGKGFSKESTGQFIDLSSLFLFLNENILSAKEKKIIEINRMINIGFSFRLGL